MKCSHIKKNVNEDFVYCENEAEANGICYGCNISNAKRKARTAQRCADSAPNKKVVDSVKDLCDYRIIADDVDAYSSTNETNSVGGYCEF